MKSDTSGCAKRHWWSGLGRGVVRLVREARRVLAASAMAAVLLCAGSWGAAATPNVVLIQADDLGWPHNSLTTITPHPASPRSRPAWNQISYQFGESVNRSVF